MSSVRARISSVYWILNPLSGPQDPVKFSLKIKWLKGGSQPNAFILLLFTFTFILLLFILCHPSCVCVHACACVHVLSRAWLFTTPWTVACQGGSSVHGIFQARSRFWSLGIASWDLHFPPRNGNTRVTCKPSNHRELTQPLTSDSVHLFYVISQNQMRK